MLRQRRYGLGTVRWEHRTRPGWAWAQIKTALERSATRGATAWRAGSASAAQRDAAEALQQERGHARQFASQWNKTARQRV
ncbi:hypothetical protein SBBP1_40043 [Burkholderiales bacterium]|nr:hypothetical protein SBBP1_40043 [Burkholderiales bacterium]